MILTQHPDWNAQTLPPHLLAMTHPTPKYLGFWANKQHPQLPNPVDYVDVTWNPLDRAMVVHYLMDAPITNHSRGSSWCRCCHIHNGHTERSDGVYTWPDGFAHYVATHDVRPPEEFVRHVMRAVLGS
jgi:hypothetical protein